MTCQSVLLSLILALLSDQPHPDYIADAGGLTVGFLTSYFILSSDWKKYASVALLLLWFVLLFTLYYT